MEKPTTESDEFLNILSQKGIFFILKKVAQELEICYQNDLNNTLDNILTLKKNMTNPIELLWWSISKLKLW